MSTETTKTINEQQIKQRYAEGDLTDDELEGALAAFESIEETENPPNWVEKLIAGGIMTGVAILGIALFSLCLAAIIAIIAMFLDMMMIML